MAGVRIRDRDDLERWLQGQPHTVAMPVAARVAMRVIPALGEWLAEDYEQASSIILPVFRAISVSRLAALGLKLDASVQKSTTIAAADAAAAAASNAATAAASTAHTAAYAAAAAARAAVDVDITLAAYRAAYAIYITTTTAAIIWQAIEHDINILINKEEINLAELINRPLWPDGMPRKLRRLWASMKKRLEARTDEHWDVWTNWYEARLDPSREIPCYSPPIPELERKRVLELKEEDWKAGPAVANAKIKQLIEEHGCLASEDNEAENKNDEDTDEQTIVPVVPAPVGSDLNGKFIMVATPFATQRHGDSALLSIALPWRTLSNIVPDPLEVLLESSDDSLRLERAESGEEILQFLSDGDEETRLVLEQLLDSGEASIYFGSIESLFSEALKGKSLPEVLKGFARLSKRQYRVGIVRLAGAILILGIAAGGAVGSYYFLSNLGGELGHIVASRLKEGTKKNLENEHNESSKAKGERKSDPDTPDVVDI